MPGCRRACRLQGASARCRCTRACSGTGPSCIPAGDVRGFRARTFGNPVLDDHRDERVGTLLGHVAVADGQPRHARWLSAVQSRHLDRTREPPDRRRRADWPLPSQTEPAPGTRAAGPPSVAAPKNREAYPGLTHIGAVQRVNPKTCRASRHGPVILRRQNGTYIPAVVTHSAADQRANPRIVPKQLQDAVLGSALSSGGLQRSDAPGSRRIPRALR